MPKAQESIHVKIVQSMLKLASELPWNDISFDEIIVDANVELSDVQDFYTDKNDILAMYAKQLNKALEAQYGNQTLEGDSHKDQLFDILMERFDLLNENRQAVVSILNGVTLDPHQMVIAMPWVCQSMQSVLDMAGIPSNGWQGALRNVGLTSVYIKTLRTWVADESQDLSITMAALDKNLGYAERASQFFKI